MSTETPFRAPRMITYPLPLRGMVVLCRFDLPEDLTADEAEKIARFVRSLAVDAEP